jgi:hypothetical protein
MTIDDPDSDSYFESLRARHAGRRGFVIGNGPSLRIEDLTALKANGEISIASNKIFLAYDQTDWRPDYFTIADIVLWKKIRGEIHRHVDLVHLQDTFGKGDAQCQVRRWHCVGLAGEKDGSTQDFSGDVAQGIYGGCSVTYVNLQLAVHLGLNPIYLIGCDHCYKGEDGVQRDVPVQAGVENNHFVPNYRVPGEMVNPAPLNLMERAYRHAFRYAELHGIAIFNATRGGNLNVFPRVEFDELWERKADK